LISRFCAASGIIENARNRKSSMEYLYAFIWTQIRAVPMLSPSGAVVAVAEEKSSFKIYVLEKRLLDTKRSRVPVKSRCLSWLLGYISED
jgi:hypothetical protein